MVERVKENGFTPRLFQNPRKDNGFIPHLFSTLKRQEVGFTPHLFSMPKKGEGFIALISVIVITLILLTMTATLGTKGFLDRFNILEGEAKEISAGLASACVESARIKIARDGDSYTGGETLIVVTDPLDATKNKTCDIVSVTHSTGASTIQTHAVYKSATTNYEVEVDTDDELIPIVSWKEF